MSQNGVDMRGLTGMALVNVLYYINCGIAPPIILLMPQGKLLIRIS
jgi:hypothetical protein